MFLCFYASICETGCETGNKKTQTGWLVLYLGRILCCFILFMLLCFMYLCWVVSSSNHLHFYVGLLCGNLCYRYVILLLVFIWLLFVCMLQRAFLCFFMLYFPGWLKKPRAGEMCFFFHKMVASFMYFCMLDKRKRARN